MVNKALQRKFTPHCAESECDFESHQVVVWFDAKELPEVAKRQRGVCFQTEIWVVMRRGQVAALTATHAKCSLVE